MKQLAINGGTPVTTRPFPSWPVWDEKEKQNLLRVLDAGQWGTIGNESKAFARRFADYIGTTRAIPVNNGTQALELMLRGAGIGRGDEVIVPSYTSAASVSAVAYIGAMPVFADVEPETGNLDAGSVRTCITERTKAVLAVHVAGRPCDMDALRVVAEKHHLLLLEDCAHAQGSSWKGVLCGALGHASAFSFQTGKVLTGGEGGMILTSDDEQYVRSWRYHHSGRAPAGVDRNSLGGQVLMGGNGRMAEWQAAVLNAQMDRLEEQRLLRTANQQKATERIRHLPGVIVPPEDERITSLSGFRYTFRYTGGRDAFVEALRAEGIPCGKGCVPVHRMGFLNDPAFEKMTGRRFAPNIVLPNTERLSQEAVWIPGEVFLADDEAIECVAEAIRKVADAMQG